jgi:lysophospholipase L1-like esterase
MTPFLFGLAAWAQDIDPLRGRIPILAALAMLAAMGAAFPLARRLGALGGFVAVLVTLVVLVWRPTDSRDVADGDVEPVYSYAAARASPEAFARWWAFFVKEVVRTNAIVLEVDPTGTPDFQGVPAYRPRPGAHTQFYKGEITINNRGYRGDDIPAEKGDTFRIVTVGDSVTFGQTLFPDSRPWSAVLQDLIRQNLSCSRSIQIINGGVNNAHVINAVERLERDAPWLKPDMVLSYFGWNAQADLGVDFGLAQMPAEQNQGPALRILARLRQTGIAILRTVWTGLVESLHVDADAGQAAFLSQARSGQLYRQFEELVGQSHRLGYQLVLLSFNTAVTPASPQDAINFYRQAFPYMQTTIKGVELENILLRQLARPPEVSFIDTGRGLYGQFDDDLFIDVVHFTAKGDRMMAANVFDGLRPLLVDNAVLGCRAR